MPSLMWAEKCILAANQACILIGQVYTIEDAVQTVKAGRESAKPDTRHIHKQIEKFAAEWQGS